MKIKNKAWLAAVLLSVSMVAAGGASPALAADAGPESVQGDSTGSEYLLNVGGEEVSLSEGESATYTMVATTPDGEIAPNATYPSNCGTLTVTASAGVYNYGINMTCPATDFVGHFGITDLTSGLSGGNPLVLGFSGSIPTSKLHGHRYSGTLTGTAGFLGAIVSVVVPNNTLYTYP